MSEHLRRLLRDVAGEAPDAVDPAVARRAGRRRQAAALGTGSLLVVAGGLGALALVDRSGRDALDTAPLATAPSMPSHAPTEEPRAEPSSRPTPSSTSPSSAAAPSSDGERFPGLPATIIAAEGSRIATYRTSDGERTSWLSPSDPGVGVGRLAVSARTVLYAAGDAEKNTQNVRLVVHPARAGSGPSHIGEPGTFMPAVLDDGSRHAFLASGDDSAYQPPSPDDLRLVLSDAGGDVQDAALDADWLLGGLAFASPDRLVLSVARSEDRGRHGLQVYDFQTDEARLGSRSPDVRFLPAPAGCSWTLPTETPAADRVLVLERCSTPEGGDLDAVTVDVATGARVGLFGTVRPAGPGQVDSLDLDLTGRHLLAKVHSGALPPTSAPEGAPVAGLVTTSLGGGRTVTTTERLVSPAWR